MKTKHYAPEILAKRILTAIQTLALFFAVLAVPAGVRAAEADREAAIGHLEKLAAKPVIGDSYIDLTLAVGRVLDPDLDAAGVKKQIAGMADEVRKVAEGKDAPADQVAAMNKVIYGTHQFSVPASDAPIISGKDALNLYLLHRFITTRLAHCEGQATLYAVVGEAAGLPVAVCNAPIHSYCQFGTGESHLNVECTRKGGLRSDAVVHHMNGARPESVNTGVYFCPLSKRQFLCLQINSLVYGLAKQENGPAPLTMKQLVRLADLIEKLDPDRPESLDTVALVYSQAGDYRRAVKIEEHVLECAERLGTTYGLMTYYRSTLKEYKQKAGEQADKKP
jgi:hypothetical protein